MATKSAAPLLLVLLAVCQMVEGNVDLVPRIVHGDDAEEHEYPFMVGLEESRAKKWDHICGGSLISPRIVLTAAHCLFEEIGRNKYREMPVEKLRVVVGDHVKDAAGKHEEEYKIAKLINHEGYNPRDYKTMANDVALIVLKEKVELKPGKIETIPLAQDRNFYAEGTSVTVIGWGLNEKKKISNILQELEYHIADQKACWKQYRMKPVKGQFGTLDSKLRSNDDKGDSGGPLFVKVADKFTQIGLVSWGKPLSKKKPFCSIFSDLVYYRDWIEGKMKNGENPDEKPDENTDISQWIEITSIKRSRGRVTCEIEPRKYGKDLNMKTGVRVMLRIANIGRNGKAKISQKRMWYQRSRTGAHTYTYTFFERRFKKATTSCYKCYAYVASAGSKLHAEATYEPAKCSGIFN